MQRRIGLVQAVSLNMAMMVGVGPFITIPALVGAMGGPQAVWIWVLGGFVAVADGFVWSELAAAFPGSGGTYHFFDAIFGDSRAGRLLKFLFIWELLCSGPLELASGMLGCAEYVAYLVPKLNGIAWEWHWGRLAWVVRGKNLLAVGVTAGLVVLCYRRIEAASRLLLILWLGMLGAVAWVIVAGFAHFDWARAWDVPPGVWAITPERTWGLGAALGLAMYSYLGYYQVCYLGDEVVDPPRTIPRSILVAVVAVGSLYFAMTLGIVGAIPWREVKESHHIVCDLIARVQGAAWAGVMAALVAWSAVAACFAGLTGYSRIPYAAAKAGHFFRGLAHLHPKGDFPDRALLLFGGLTALACLAEIDAVIAALLTSRVLVQYVLQGVLVIYLRTRPDLMARLRYRMILFPVPAWLAIAGWLVVFGTTPIGPIVYGLGSLGVGVAAFLIWDAATRRVGI